MKLIATIALLTCCVIAHAGPKEDMEKDANALVQSNAQLLADFKVKLTFMQDQVFKPRVAQYEAESTEYNARCNRQFNRETEITQYTQCNTDKARIDAERVSTQQWMDDTTAKWNAENQVPVNAQIEKNNARLKELQVAYAALPK